MEDQHVKDIRENKIQFSFDDVHEDNDKLFNLMSNYDFSVVWFIDFRNEELAEKQINRFRHQKGHEIGNHTMTHPLLTRVPLEHAQKEITDANKKIKEITGNWPDWFCPPRGYVDKDIERMLRVSKFKYVRLTTVDGSDTKFMKKKLIHIYPRPEYNGKHWDEFAEERMKAEEDIHIWGHSWEIDKYDQWIRLENFLSKHSQA